MPIAFRRIACGSALAVGGALVLAVVSGPAGGHVLSQPRTRVAQHQLRLVDDCEDCYQEEEPIDDAGGGGGFDPGGFDPTGGWDPEGYYPDPNCPDPSGPDCYTAPADQADSDGSDTAADDYTTDDNSDEADDVTDQQVPAATPCRYNNNVANLITAHEGNRAHVYTDTAGHPSIGIGFNLDRPDARAAITNAGANYDQVRAGQANLTDAQVQQLFQGDLATARNRAAHFVPNFASLSQAQQDVLTDMAFNLGNGIGNFHNMIGNVQQGDFVNAAQEMLNSRWATQTGDRATQDADIMRNCQ